MIDITGTDYSYDESQQTTLDELSQGVSSLRQGGKLTPDVLHRLRKYFRIKNIYHSNAIEGNQLTVGETREVVEMGLTITGKPLKDQAEAANLSAALDFLEDLASDNTKPITEMDIRTIHTLVLKGISPGDEGVYRSVAVEISGSEFQPPGPEFVPQRMQEFGDWLSAASCPGTNFATTTALLVASVAHTWLVTVHPFIDGNGRVARLLMNVLLMRYGFPIAVISRDDRLRYYDALEFSQSSDLSAFIALICECIHESLEEYEQATAEQRANEEWAKSLGDRLGAPGRARASNEYELWKSAQDLFSGYMRQTAAIIDESSSFGNVYFKDFGMLELEKYLALKSGDSAKRTWFFRVDFRSDQRAARYLFFFGRAAGPLRDRCDVSLFISREHPPGSFYYERLDRIQMPDVPSISQIAYDPKEERFLAQAHNGTIREDKIEHIGRNFVEEVVKMQFAGDSR